MELGQPDDLFGGKKLKGLSTGDMLLDVAKENKGYIKGALLLPVLVTSCNSSPEGSVNITTNLPTIVGTVVGVVSGLEEIIEKSRRRNIPKKIGAVIAKSAAGFGLGYTLTHNFQNGGSWLSTDNLPHTVSLAASTYVIAKETSLPELLGGLGAIVAEKGKKVAVEVKQAVQNEHELSSKLPVLERAIKDANNTSLLNKREGVNIYNSAVRKLAEDFSLDVYKTWNKGRKQGQIVTDGNGNPQPDRDKLKALMELMGKDKQLQLDEAKRILGL